MVLISVLISCLIFCILFITLKHFTSLLNILIYAICCTIKLFIITGMKAAFGTIILWFIVNAIIGIAVVWVLNKIVDSLSPLVFILVAILVQEIIGYVLLLILV